MKWLGAMALPSSEPVAVATARRLIDMHAGPSFHVYANIYDQKNQSCLSDLVAHYSGHVFISTVPGYMLRFWKTVLTAELTAHYDIIMLVHCDIWWTHEMFSLVAVEEWMQRTKAGSVMPSIVASTKGARAAGAARRQTMYAADCAAKTLNACERIAIQTPAVYRIVWELLQEMPDLVLDADLMLMDLWCQKIAVAWPTRPACVVIHSMAVVHDNTKTISKAGMDKYYCCDKKTIMQHDTYYWIMNNYKSFLGNFSWGNTSFPLGTCFPIDPDEPRRQVGSDLRGRDSRAVPRSGTRLSPRGVRPSRPSRGERMPAGSKVRVPQVAVKTADR